MPAIDKTRDAILHGPERAATAGTAPRELTRRHGAGEVGLDLLPTETALERTMLASLPLPVGFLRPAGEGLPAGSAARDGDQAARKSGSQSP